MLSFSVVINTFNRALSLAATLESLRFQQYSDFEVIVVNGPSTDDTEALLAKWGGKIRVGRCEQRNLSVSRNVGIAMAHGEIVAFIDDDAIPTEEWLAELAAEYRSPTVGGVGGFVYDHTGVTFQAKFVVCDRTAKVEAHLDAAPSELCFPGTLKFPHLLGTNASYRRSALLATGGFDEEYEYYLDETDVCVRLVDAGYEIVINPKALVYHNFLASHIRGADRLPTNWYPMVKNKWYFCCKNATGHLKWNEIETAVNEFTRSSRNWVREVLSSGPSGDFTIQQFDRDALEGQIDGVERGLHHPRRLMDSPAAKQQRGMVELDDYPAGILPYPVHTPARDPLTICLLTQQYPPGVVGGVARMAVEMATGLVAQGHRVHVLTRSPFGHSTVDWEDGVWVHRVAVSTEHRPPAGFERLAHLWQYSFSVLQELRRIRSIHPVHIVDAPLWDAEGWATILDGTFHTVTSIETPLRIVVPMHPVWRTSTDMAPMFEEQYRAEAFVAASSTAIRCNTKAMAQALSDLYGVGADPWRLNLVPHGIRDVSREVVASRKEDGRIRILFVGRLEPRKGIDVLLDAAPEILTEFPDAEFIIVGEDTDSRCANSFSEAAEHEPWRTRITFLGALEEAVLMKEFAECDVFVAPSRFESFGLIFLEAMMFGKPVIGCDAGGMPEVVEDGVTGLLAEPGNTESLRTCLRRLIADPLLRSTLGAAGRLRFESDFTHRRMIDRTLEVYRSVVQRTPALR